MWRSSLFGFKFLHALLIEAAVRQRIAVRGGEIRMQNLESYNVEAISFSHLLFYDAVR